jgi:flavin-dependent dehydrogenase
MRAPLIIGGGPAGAAAAALIAAAGREVTLLERHAEPTDKVCGDFLSGEALTALQMLGLDALSIGATPLRTIRLVNRHRAAEAPLPFAAAGLSRRVLDEALLSLAAQRGAPVRRGHTVRTLERSADGLTVRATNLAPLVATSVFLATGKHDLRGVARPPRPDGLLGLKMYYELAADQQAALNGIIELLLFPGGYAGLQMVEQHRAVLCLLLPVAHWRRVGGHWPTLLDSLVTAAPLLGRRLAGATPCLDRPLAIAGTPYGHLHRPDHADTDLFRLGDQACVIPSLAGDGVAMALHSAIAATATWLRGDNARAYHHKFVRQVRTPLHFASLIHFAARIPAMQPIIAAACQLWPGTLRLAASATRATQAR